MPVFIARSNPNLEFKSFLRQSECLKKRIYISHYLMSHKGNRPTSVSCGAHSNETQQQDEDFFPGISSFVELNKGSWNGHYYQFNFSGETTHSVKTKISSKVTGIGEDRNLNQTLHVLQALPRTHVAGEETEPVWKSIGLQDTNRFTVNRTQQLTFFEDNGAFAVSHQTAEIIDKVLRIGVLGPDDEEEEFPKGIKLPSTRPALVTETCLFSPNKAERIRAFQILDPRGVVDTLGFFHEFQDPYSQAFQGKALTVHDLLGKWKGKGLVKRSPTYGGTTAEQEAITEYILEEDGSLVQVGPPPFQLHLCLVTQSGNLLPTMMQRLSLEIGGNVRSMTSVASVMGHVLRFKGLQTLLLPGGVALSCPSVVTRGQAFAFEFCWMSGPTQRQRLQRTYDTDGLVVSNTLFVETKEL